MARTGRPPKPAIDRTLARRKIVFGPPGVDGDCWLYEGARRGQPMIDEPDNDYRKMRIVVEPGHYRMEFVHRVSFVHYHGPIPVEHVVRHKCDRRACFAPHHLESGTIAENTFDMIMRGRSKLVQHRATEPAEAEECPF